MLNEYQLFESPPPATSVIDTAIELFARLLPLQELPSTAKYIQQVLELVRSPKLDKNVGRKSAVFVNVIVAFVLVLRHVMTTQIKQAKETFGSPQVTTLLSPFLKARPIILHLVIHSSDFFPVRTP